MSGATRGSLSAGMQAGQHVYQSHPSHASRPGIQSELAPNNDCIPNKLPQQSTNIGCPASPASVAGLTGGSAFLLTISKPDESLSVGGNCRAATVTSGGRHCQLQTRCALTAATGAERSTLVPPSGFRPRLHCRASCRPHRSCCCRPHRCCWPYSYGKGALAQAVQSW